MTTRRDDRRLAWMLGAAAAGLLLTGLGWTDLWAPDEPRIGQVAEELHSMRHGAAGLVLLHANGEPYTQKPPLYYWAAAAIAAGSGSERVGEVAARLPSALAGLACIALTVALGRNLFGDPRVGLWAGALLLTVFRFAHLARRAQFDILLTLFEVGALLAFARIESGRGSSRSNLVWLHACLGLAVLTKGPVGLLPLLGIGAYLAWQGRLREVRGLLPVWSPLLSLLPALLWLGAAVALAPAGFFEEAVLENVVGRFVAGTSHARPFYYFALQYPLDFLPWTLAWPLAAAVVWPIVRAPSDPTASPDQRGLRLLVAWTAVCLVVFSLSAGKRGLYLMPVFPATALLCAYALVTRTRATVRRGLLGTLAALAVGVAAIGAYVVAASPVEFPNNPGFEVPVRFGVSALCIGALGMLAVFAITRRAASQGVAFGACVVGLTGLYAAVFWQVYPAFDAEKSPRPIATAALARSAPDAPIGIFDQRALVEAVAYYADRPVVHFADADAAVAFAEQPGHVLIVRSSKLARLGDAVPTQVAATLRSGRREVSIVASQPAFPAPASKP